MRLVGASILQCELMGHRLPKKFLQEQITKNNNTKHTHNQPIQTLSWPAAAIMIHMDKTRFITWAQISIVECIENGHWNCLLLSFFQLLFAYQNDFSNAFVLAQRRRTTHYRYKPTRHSFACSLINLACLLACFLSFFSWAVLSIWIHRQCKCVARCITLSARSDSPNECLVCQSVHCWLRPIRDYVVAGSCVCVCVCVFVRVSEFLCESDGLKNRTPNQTPNTLMLNKLVVFINASSMILS